MPEIRALDCWKRLGAATFGAGMLLTFAATAAHAGQELAGRASFERFCSTWMGKLEERERSNLTRAIVRRSGDRVVVEYVGYTRSPLSCEAEPSGAPSTPLVGKLVYQELRYERSGASKGGALTNPPRVLSRIVVMEIFRFDGSEWVY
jgi:hypothetical protein